MDGTCSALIHIRIVSAGATIARLNGIWRSNSFASKWKLHQSVMLFIPLYGCETWALLADSEKRIKAFEARCLGKFLHISNLELKTND